MGLLQNSSSLNSAGEITTTETTLHNNNYDSQISTGIDATGAGTTLTLDKARDKHTIIVIHEAGSSAHSVNLEGSIDGTNWVTIASLTGSATEDAETVDQPFLYVRYNVATVGVGNTLGIQILSMS